MVTMAFTLFTVAFMTLPCLRTTVGSLDLESLCSSRELCNRTTSVLGPRLFEQEPCCVSCSCNPDCVNVGNCCPDIGDVGLPIRPLECILPVVNPADQLILVEDFKMYGEIQRYQVVAGCPEDTIGDIHRFNCEEKAAEYPKELVIVADTRGHLFKNEFCARCNGVVDYTQWQLRFRSSFMGELFSYSPSKSFSEFKNIMFWSQPPDPDAHEGSRCFSSIDSCNETGLWTGDADPYLIEMCNNVSLYYIHSNSVYFYVYKNPFCFLCNTASELSSTDLFCKFDTPNIYYIIEDAFSAALSPLLIGDELKTTETRPWNCERDYMYDPFSNTCRQLVCPIYSFPLYGECPDILEELTGINIAVVFTAEIYVTGKDEAEDMVRKRFGILTKMEDVLTLTKYKCTRCDLTILIKHGNNQLHLAFKVIYTTAHKCHLVFLKSALTTGFSAFANEMWLYPDAISFVPSVLPGNSDLIKDGFAEIQLGDPAWQEFGFCSSLTIDLNDVSFCPRFEFSEELFEGLKEMRSTMPQSHIVNGENQTRYVICVEDYLTMSTGNQPLMGHYVYFAILVSLTSAMFFEF